MPIEVEAAIADAIERWNNSGGFACSFPDDCSEAIYILAADRVRLDPTLRELAEWRRRLLRGECNRDQFKAWAMVLIDRLAAGPTNEGG
jgi:hypothetical protein